MEKIADNNQQKIEDKEMVTDEVVSAIKAAVRKAYPEINEKDFEVEVAHALREVRFQKRGTMTWRSMPIGKKLFEVLLNQQNNQCFYCKKEFNSSVIPTLEHVKQIRRHGADHPDNFVVSCKKCNNNRR